MAVNIVERTEQWLLKKSVRRFLYVASAPIILALILLSFNMATAVSADRAVEEFGIELPAGWSAAVESHSRGSSPGKLRRWEGPTIGKNPIIFILAVLTIVAYVGLLFLMGIVFEKNKKQIQLEHLEDHLKDRAMQELKKIRRRSGRA